MKPFKRVYVEITDVCNLACSFCPGTRRPPRFLSPEEFRVIAEKLRPCTDYLYFHLMGEPLLHPELGALLAIAGELGFLVNLTTNGTLLARTAGTLLASPALRKVSVSLHSFEANGAGELDRYLEDVLSFVRAAREAGVICELRLWNDGGADALNGRIARAIERTLGVKTDPALWPRRDCKLGERLFLSRADRFDWPGGEGTEERRVFCYGLRDHFGVLCDGTAVPCCLDGEGAVPLGNLLVQPLEEILESPRARAIRAGFDRREAVEKLCQSCGYARRF